MRGEILSFDQTTGQGLISGDDGLRYDFAATDVQSGFAVPGHRVDFAPDAGRAVQLVILAPAPATTGVASSAGSAGTDAIQWQPLMLQFNGRIRRSHFWIGWLVLFGAGLVLGFIPLLGTLVSIALIWPNLAITVKRLHDMGYSGWLAAIPYVVTLVGVIAAFSMVGMTALMNAQALENEDPAAVLALVGPAFGVMLLVGLIGLGFLLWIGLTPGKPGSNAYGTNPKG